MPSTVPAHVSRSCQSNRGAPARDAIRTGWAPARSRSATRRPVVPVPPVTRTVPGLLRASLRVVVSEVVVMSTTEARQRERVHRSSARIHARASTLPPVDALAGLLDGPRARNAFLLRTVFRPPWSVRVHDEAPLSVVAVVSGRAWIVPDDGVPVELAPGDVAVARGPVPYLLADDPATPPQVIIHPEQRCTTPDGEPLHEAMSLGVRTWGNDPHGTDVHLVGTYLFDGEVGRRLLNTLPT